MKDSTLLIVLSTIFLFQQLWTIKKIPTRIEFETKDPGQLTGRIVDPNGKDAHCVPLWRKLFMHGVVRLK